MIFLRSLIFFLIKAVMTIPFSLITLMTFPFPAMLRYHVISQWSGIVNWLARVVVGITWRGRGLGQFAVGTGGGSVQTPVGLGNHRVSGEIFPPLSFVLKKSLLYIPFFGWGLALFSPIAIDRGAGREALKQIESQGRARLKTGFWVLIFPEGTRVVPGEAGKFHWAPGWR